MRRLLALLVAAAPGLAAPQTVPSAGQVLFSPDAVLNQADCASTTTTVGLTWQVKPDSTFATGGTFNVYAYASSLDVTSSPWCYTNTASGAKLLISSLSASSALVTSVQAVGTADVASVVAPASCDAGSFTVTVCVQWLKADSSVGGYAKGTVTVSLDGPARPTVTGVSPGEEALNVTIEPGTGSTVDAVEFRAKAVAVDPLADGATHYSTRSTSRTQRVAGLQNGVPYTVTAFAYSSAGNVSAESDPFGTAVAPRTVANAWEYYQTLGGRDDGGCASGGTGILALLGAAALGRLRRRP